MSALRYHMLVPMRVDWVTIETYTELNRKLGDVLKLGTVGGMECVYNGYTIDVVNILHTNDRKT